MNREVVFSEKPPFPRNMLMELANICNHKCVFCGYKDMKRKKSMCNKEQMLDILRQAYENGTREVGFYIIGEPFVCQDLAEYVAYAKNLGYEYVYLTTNGALATLDRCKEVIAAGLDSIKFSLNAATRESYLAVHGKDDFFTVKENIYALRNYVQDHGLDVFMFISFVKNELNKEDITELNEVFGSVVDKIYIYPCGNQCGRMLGLIDQGVVKKEEFRVGGFAPCEMCFNRLHITCEGYLSACCGDVDGYLAAVDLHKVSLVDAWNSEVMTELRRKHLRDELDGLLCYNCVKTAEKEFSPLNRELISFE